MLSATLDLFVEKYNKSTIKSKMTKKQYRASRGNQNGTVFGGHGIRGAGIRCFTVFE